MSINTFIVIAAFFAGVMIAAQGILNAKLASHIGGALPAAIASFIVGLLALLLISLFVKTNRPSLIMILHVPYWAWIGGLLGTFMVVLAVKAVPKVGVTTFISAVIAGQMIAALVYDHYGVLGQQVREVSPEWHLVKEKTN